MPHVLLVEDDRLTRIILRDMLKKTGFQGAQHRNEFVYLCALPALSLVGCAPPSDVAWRQQLSADCASVTIAENGDKALNLLERPKLKSAYTVILTDVHMPKVRIRLGRPQCLLSP